MDIREELKSAGVYPTGPVSAWPEERNIALHKKTKINLPKKHKTKVEATPGQMAKGLLKTAGQAIRNGSVSAEIRNERYETCKACPQFIEDSKRCASCGCFMEGKTWVNGDPNLLCPLKKWNR
jgi:hypothetical protein